MSEIKVTGVIPAAGNASRLAPLPFSKELYPISFGEVDKKNTLHPKTSMQYLLENMRSGGADSVYVVIKKGKWDIPSYFIDGSQMNLHLAYLMMGLPFGPPFTIDQAYPFLKDDLVLFGFPDILVLPNDAYKTLAEKLKLSEADAILGLHQVEEPECWDMVKIDENGKVLDLVIKKAGYPDYAYGWAIMAWKPAFTEFLHSFVKQLLGKNQQGKIEENGIEREPIISDVVKAAVKSGLTIDSHVFSNGKVLDVGTVSRIISARNFFENNSS
jgi:glucose-1-phosphate thymidylyltransferase